MQTPASILKHPIHPMLIVFPIGLWIFSLACDLLRVAGISGEVWSTVAFPVVLSIIGVVLLFVSGWLGGQMVNVYGVGVEGRE